MGFLRRRHDEAPLPAPVADRPAVAAPVQRDWAEIPALQRIGTELHGVVDTGFDTDLSSWHSPGVLRPLDHALSQDAPSGMVLQSIARSALPRNEARPAAGTTVQRTVTFEPPRRPTVTFSAEAPRTLEAVTIPHADPVATGVVAPHPSPSFEPDGPATETSAPPSFESAAAYETAAGDEPATADQPASDSTEPAAPTPADLPVAVAPTLGDTTPAPPAPTTPPAAAPIQRASRPSPRPLGLGPPMAAGTSEGPVARGTPWPGLPVQRAGDGRPPAVTTAPASGAFPTTPAPSAEPLVQRHASAEHDHGETADHRDDEPPLLATAAPTGETPAPDAAPVPEPDRVETLDGDDIAAADAAVEIAEPTTTPLLGGQPPLLDPAIDVTEPALDAPEIAPGQPAPPVVQTRRSGLGEPRGATPVLADVVQRTVADVPAAATTDDEEHDLAGADAGEPVPTAPLLPSASPIIAPVARSSDAAPPAPGRPAPFTPTSSRLAPAPTIGPSLPGAAPATPIQRLAPSTAMGATPGPEAVARAGATVAPRAGAVTPTLGFTTGPPPGPSRDSVPAGGPAAGIDDIAPAQVAAPAPTPAPAPTVVALLGERSLAAAVAPRAERSLDGGPSLQRLAVPPRPVSPAGAAPDRRRPHRRRRRRSRRSARARSGRAAHRRRFLGGCRQRGDRGRRGPAPRRRLGGVRDAAGRQRRRRRRDRRGRAARRRHRGSTATAPTGTGGARAADGSDLDELAKRLYSRLRVMLKHELRLDRERAGILTQGRR